MRGSENLYLQLNVIACESDNDKWTVKSVAASGTLIVGTTVSLFDWKTSAE